MNYPPQIEFWVHGHPGPSGSKRGFVNKYTGRVALVDAGGERTKRWRQNVHAAATRAMCGFTPFPPGVPLSLEVEFHMPRPKHHFGSGRKAGEIKITAPSLPTTMPDRTKLLRGTEDELTGVIWADDCAVVSGDVRKVYANDGVIGARIVVRPVYVNGETPMLTVQNEMEMR